jgi:hypothetical protein
MPLLVPAIVGGENDAAKMNRLRKNTEGFSNSEKPVKRIHPMMPQKQNAIWNNYFYCTSSSFFCYTTLVMHLIASFI